MTLWEHEKQTAEILKKARRDSPELCARLLTTHLAGCVDSIQYELGKHTQTLSLEQQEILANLVKRRANGEPLAYILGKKAFYEHDFKVSTDTLIPRPETELCVDLALEFFPNAKIDFVDIGCGSGCIGLSLLACRPNWRGFLLDYSVGALKIAAENARNIAPYAIFLQGDIFNLPFKTGSLDLIVSNPPYIGASEIKNTMPEVLAYEPHLALFSEKDGLGHLEAIILHSFSLLRKGGRIILEHGYLQAEAVLSIMRQANFKNLQTHNDLAGLPRCASGQKL